MKHISLLVACIFAVATLNAQQKKTTTNPGKDYQEYSGKKMSSLDCKKIITDADVKALGFDGMKERSHTDYWHDIDLKKGHETMIRFQIIQSGADGYKGSLEGAKMLAKGMKAGKQEFKSTFTEENKYGDKSYLNVCSWSDVELGILKGNYYISIKAYIRDNQTVAQATEVVKKLAAVTVKRMP